jgi:ketosteroid isomerase-like protein
MRFILGLAILLSPALAFAESTDHDRLRALLDDFLAGASVNDVATHERFWADDLIYTSSAGQRFGKSAILEGMAQAESEDDPPGPVYSAADVDIRVFDSTAVVTFRLIATDTEGEKAEFLNTGVFRKDGHQWRAFTWQATHAAEQ